MAIETSDNTFRQLAAGISSDERAILLEKIKAVSTNLSEQTLENPFQSIDNIQTDISAELKSEFFLYKVILWLRSLFSGANVEELYAKDKVARLASELSGFAPGLVDYPHRYLTTLFYEYIRELKGCADFFRPYLSVLRENYGSYYVFLSSLILPDIDTMVNSEADPFQTPPKPNFSKEYRTSLLRRLDDILSNIPPISRNVMYKSVQSVDWLIQFSNLPFEDMLSTFSCFAADSYVCSFKNVGMLFSEFVRVLSAGKSVTGEILESMFLFIRGKSNMAEMDEFLASAQKHLEILHGFIASVPLVRIGKIVFEDYSWQPETFGGAEDWFVKFRNEWRVRFDRRWEQWIFECKKEGIREKLKVRFSMENFPLLENRPWTEVWGGMPFKFEFTAGFISWYFMNVFPKDIKVLKFLQLEGDFEKSENKENLTSALNDLIQVETSIVTLNQNLGRGGEFGMLFDRLSNDKLRTTAALKKINSMMANCEAVVINCKKDFCTNLRMLVCLLKGIFKDSSGDDFLSVKNLDAIAGTKNTAYISELIEIKQKFLDILELISGMEMLEIENVHVSTH